MSLTDKSDIEMNMEAIYRLLLAGDESRAAAGLRQFLTDGFGLAVETLEFQQSAVSLNSFKGVFEVEDGTRYFFKTHIEEEGEVQEYAGAQLLVEAGYPMISPAFVSQEKGRELLVYPYIEDRSLFDWVKLINEGEANDKVDAIVRAQEALDRRLFEIYRETLRLEAPEYPDVQQLFYRRLESSRYDNFYRGQSREFAGQNRSFEALLAARWIVNGVDRGGMSEWLASARRLLAPESMLPFSVVGHGDAHNGNVFFGEDELGDARLRYFDPAYAGRMDPFLDLSKPIFHNTCARWMYFPEWVERDFTIDVSMSDGVVRVDMDFEPSDIERSFFNSKVKNVLAPMLRLLRERGILPADWEDRLRASLLCCPLLTMNLFDESKYSPSISALGFAVVAEMANFDFKSLIQNQ
jgi:hypothetical protein